MKYIVFLCISVGSLLSCSKDNQNHYNYKVIEVWPYNTNIHNSDQHDTVNYTAVTFAVMNQDSTMVVFTFDRQQWLNMHRYNVGDTYNQHGSLKILSLDSILFDPRIFGKLDNGNSGSFNTEFIYLKPVWYKHPYKVGNMFTY